MKKKTWFILTLIVLVSGAISVCLLTRGQTWLDDWAGYLMQAKSILGGNMADVVRQNSFAVAQSSYPPGPAAYPWGFPLLLAPVYAVFGMNALAFQLVNTLCYALFLVVLFALARTRLGEAGALALTAALALNPALLGAHDQILSDIPFLLFSTCAIYLIDRSLRGKASVWLSLATGAAIFAASFTRTNGILLLVPLVAAQAIRLWPERKNTAFLRTQLKSSLVPYLAFGVLFAAQALVFPNGQDSYLSHFSMFNLQHLWDNVLYYITLPAATFDQLPGGAFFYPLLLVFVPVSALKRGSRDLPIHLYSLATVGLFVVWPERQGLRFIFPVLPFLFLFGFEGMQLAISQVAKDWQSYGRVVVWTFWLSLAIASLWVSLAAARDNLAGERAINGPFDPISAQMFKFIREETPAESVIIFFKPRSMELFTGRNAFMTERCADLNKGDYLALSEKVGNNGQIAPDAVDSCTGVKLTEVFNNKRFVVYKIFR